MLKQYLTVTAITMILAAMMSGCGTFTHKTQTSLQGLEESDRPNIETVVEGAIPVEHVAGKRVHVSFSNSEKLTRILADKVEKSGGTVVMATDQADLILAGRGEYAALRQFGNRKVRADIGEVVESGGEIKSIDQGLSIAISHGGELLNAGQATALLTGLDAVSRATGFSGWFNNLVAGDPDGICFRGCEYKQAAVIQITMKDREGRTLDEAMITSKAEHKALWPVPMIEMALNEFGSFIGKQ